MDIKEIEFCWHDGALTKKGNACPVCGSWNSLKDLRYYTKGTAYPIPGRLLSVKVPDGITTVANACFCKQCGDIALCSNTKVCGACGSHDKLLQLKDYLAFNAF
jgi:RNA polymerase subunit RPABC4/transcription elongation factor Spt4